MKFSPICKFMTTKLPIDVRRCSKCPAICTNTSCETVMPLAYCCNSDRVVHIGPFSLQTPFQFVQICNTCAIHPLAIPHTLAGNNDVKKARFIDYLGDNIETVKLAAIYDSQDSSSLSITALLPLFLSLLLLLLLLLL